jgi:hypothetical protein
MGALHYGGRWPKPKKDIPQLRISPAPAVFVPSHPLSLTEEIRVTAKSVL